MPAEERPPEPDQEQVQEERVAYRFERYQEAREETVAAELRVLEEAIAHNTTRILDLREYMTLRFEGVDQRLDELRSYVDQRFAQIDQRLIELRSYMDQRFQQVDQRLDEHRAYMDQRFAQVDQRFAQVDQRLDEHRAYMDQRFTDMRTSFEERLNALERSTRIQFGILTTLIIAVLIKLFLG